MKTLIIHPEDKTTDMLKHAYENHPEYTVCRDNGITKADRRLHRNHDHIIMLGHGLPGGLICSNRCSFLIDDSFAQLFKSKDTVSVWCYSDQYFRRHQILGFHTGMIISEPAEEFYILGKLKLDEQQMLENFRRLSVCLSECLEMKPEEMKQYLLEHYRGDDEVTRFNRSSFIVL